MAQPHHQPTAPQYQQIRLRGREIDLNYILSMSMLNISNSSNQDLENESKYFNSWKNSVNNLNDTLSPYADRRYYEDNKALNTFDAVMLDDKIDFMRSRFQIAVKLMKRIGFIPPDDVEAEPFILLEHLRSRVKKQLDALIGVEGDRGTGKSYTVLWLCCQLNPDFRNLDRVFFNADQFREMLEKTKYPPGTCFIWDEATAGRGLNKRQSMTTENIEFNKLLQVIRKRRYIVFFTLPTMDLIDIASIDYFGGKIKPLWINQKEKKAYMKFQEKTGTIWPYIRTPTGERITTIAIPKIDNSLANKYEKLKDVFLDETIKRKEKKPARKTNDELAQEVIERLEEYVLPDGKLDKPKIENDLDIGARRLKKICFKINNHRENEVKGLD